MTLSPVKIDLWVWPIDGGRDAARSYDTVLSGEETARADRFLNPDHGLAFRIAHGRLREILGSLLNVAPGTLVFDTGAHGKPSLTGVGSHLAFNLTHSGSFAALAVGEGYELGVDIEEIRPIREDIADRYFSRDEIAQLDALPESRRADAFFRCWTRKEAIVKALGDGLSMPLDRFTVDIMAETECGLLHGINGTAPSSWRVMPFVPAPGYHGAIAARTDGRRIEIERHPAGTSSGLIYGPGSGFD